MIFHRMFLRQQYTDREKIRCVDVDNGSRKVTGTFEVSVNGNEKVSFADEIYTQVSILLGFFTAMPPLR